MFLLCSETFSDLIGHRKTQSLYSEPHSPTFTEPSSTTTSLTSLPLLSLCPLHSSHTGLALPWTCEVYSYSSIPVFAAFLPGVLLLTCSGLTPLSAMTKPRTTRMVLVQSSAAPETLHRGKSTYLPWAKRRWMVARSFPDFSLSRNKVFPLLMFLLKHEKFVMVSWMKWESCD